MVCHCKLTHNARSVERISSCLFKRRAALINSTNNLRDCECCLKHDDNLVKEDVEGGRSERSDDDFGKHSGIKFLTHAGYQSHTLDLVKYFKRHRVCSYKFLSAGSVGVLFPKHNKSHHKWSDCKLQVIEDVSYHPTTSFSVQMATPVIFCKPHGAEFFSSDPATIFLPVVADVATVDSIICLCSDTETGEKPKWQRINCEDYTVCGSYIMIKAKHFSFYTAVVNKGYPEASKMIYAGIGGILEVPGVPGVRVLFPGPAVQYDIEATAKVMFADYPYDVDHDEESLALAAPVIKLGPTGHHFNPQSSTPVEVHLPLPDGRAILENCGRPVLTFHRSTSAEGQKLHWELFHTDYRIHVDEDGLHSVIFPVSHFTFFRVLWGIFDSAIHEAKIGASFFFPNFQFCIAFQAYMSVSEDDSSFGLCLYCFRTGVPFESVGNYPIFVGSSGPRMVTSGLLQIRVVSRIFEANTDFEENALTHKEFFTGRPFDKQFGCKCIIPGKIPRYGTIGKVYVEKEKSDGNVEPLFDFLLTKPQPSLEMMQATQTSSQNSDTQGNDKSWEGQLSSELAALLSIKTDRDLGDDVWEDIALALGYTPLEIDMKFKGKVDPLKELLNDYKKRGGSSNDFISAMYRVGRQEKVRQHEQSIRNVLSETQGASSSQDEVNGSASPGHTSSSSGIVLPAMAVNSRKRRHASSGNEVQVSLGKLADVAKNNKVLGNWKRLGRALELDEDQIREIERDYEKDGAQEQAYQMLLAWKERYPDNGYDTLIRALGKLHLNGVARQLLFDP